MRPPELRRAMLAEVNDKVSLFGTRLSIRGAPFCQQDTEYLRCAHAAAWMCHYPAALNRLTSRFVTAKIVEASPRVLSAERALPSKGMNLNQLQAVFDALGQPALFYGFEKMPVVRGVENPEPEEDPQTGEKLPPGLWDTRVFSIVCRYLNSRFPVLIGTTDHAFVIVGWYRDTEDEIRFIANDDQRGPYELIASPFTDERRPWRSIMVPLPPRVLLSGEMAENAAYVYFLAYGTPTDAPVEWRTLAENVSKKTVSLRAFLRSGNEYKQDLETREVDPAMFELLRLARFPHFVWVVEVHDRERRANREPCVIAEAIFDSTSSDLLPRLDALALPGRATTFPPDGGKPVRVDMAKRPWYSGLDIVS
jgi:hypothetical protein